MIPPQRMRPTEYRKPGRINAVSITLMLIFAAMVYFVYCTWPIVTLRLRVKSELEDVLPNFWRVNLRPEDYALQEIARMKRELLEKLPQLGVRDKKAEVIFDRGKKRVGIEVRFTASAYFPVLNKTYVFHLAPRAETDAARVDW